LTDVDEEIGPAFVPLDKAESFVFFEELHCALHVVCSMIFDARVAPLILACCQSSTHNRFGRGRGNGTLPGPATVVCIDCRGC
jgi:hypothetical protein